MLSRGWRSRSEPTTVRERPAPERARWPPSMPAVHAAKRDANAANWAATNATRRARAQQTECREGLASRDVHVNRRTTAQHRRPPPGRRRPAGPQPRIRRRRARARPRPAPRARPGRRRGAEPRRDQEPRGDRADGGQRRAGEQRVVQAVDVLLRRAAERGLRRHERAERRHADGDPRLAERVVHARGDAALLRRHGAERDRGQRRVEEPGADQRDHRARQDRPSTTSRRPRA